MPFSSAGQQSELVAKSDSLILRFPFNYKPGSRLHSTITHFYCLSINNLHVFVAIIHSAGHDIHFYVCHFPQQKASLLLLRFFNNQNGNDLISFFVCPWCVGGELHRTLVVFGLAGENSQSLDMLFIII